MDRVEVQDALFKSVQINAIASQLTLRLRIIMHMRDGAVAHMNPGVAVRLDVAHIDGIHLHSLANICKDDEVAQEFSDRKSNTNPTAIWLQR